MLFRFISEALRGRKEKEGACSPSHEERAQAAEERERGATKATERKKRDQEKKLTAA